MVYGPIPNVCAHCVLEMEVKNVAFSTGEMLLFAVSIRPHPLTVKFVPTNCSLTSGGRQTMPVSAFVAGMTTDDESLIIE